MTYRYLKKLINELNEYDLDTTIEIAFELSDIPFQFPSKGDFISCNKKTSNRSPIFKNKYKREEYK